MNLLKMSASGALMIVVVTIIRAAAVNRLPKKTFPALWAVVLVRLLIPYSLPFAYSVYSLVPAEETPYVRYDAAFPAGETAVRSGAAVPVVRDTHKPADRRVIVWLAGVLIGTGYFSTAYWRCFRKFRESIPVDDNGAGEWLNANRLCRTVRLRQSDRVPAPLTYGVLRPVILLPKTTDWQDTDSLRFVLAHEMVHIRRFDALTKLILAAALCVHWFNPMVWVMYVLANRDLELSCDEAVVRRFGTRTRTAYASALIRMEEAKCVPSPLCSHFSRNVLEERIIAIMKIKKTTWGALLTAAALVVGITTAFATSARREDPETIDRALNEAVVYEEREILSYVDPEDGRTRYSEDGGESWLTQEEFEARYPNDDVEWWTAEGYADWLENEKANLQGMIGERGWTPSTGWFTWDQQKVDETVALYEGILKDIQNGVKVSKSVNGNEDVMLSMGTEETGAVCTFSEERNEPLPPEPTREELLALYGPFGISFNENGEMMYQNHTVRVFVDGAYTGDGGWANHYVYLNETGEVILRTVHDRIENGDGSYDPFGPLTGIVECDGETGEILTAIARPSTMEATADGDAMESDGGPGFPDVLRKYEPFGLIFVRNGNFGNVYYNGDLVDTFIDRAPDGSYMTVGSIDEGGMDVETVYDENGKLIGVQPVGTE